MMMMEITMVMICVLRGEEMKMVMAEMVTGGMRGFEEEGRT